MGAPNLKRVKLKQGKKPEEENSAQDKAAIKQYNEKIHDLVKDEKEAKKFAQIISQYINSKKK